MNDNAQSAAAPETGGEAPASGQTEDGQSTEGPQRNGGPSLFQRIANLFRTRNGSSLREDLADALAESEEDSASFSPGERAMLHNILRLREVRVEDVMVPRADIEAVDLSTTLGELLKLFEQSGHSRMPVYSETLDDPRGMVHIRDVVANITKTAHIKRARSTRRSADKAPQKAAGKTVDKATQKASGKSQEKVGELNLANVDLGRTIGELNLTRNVLFVPPSMLASDLMNRMRAARIQMALVIDEYGGTDGLASLEDIVEVVVGDIEDEHDDDDQPRIVQTGDGVFVVDAKAEIDDVAQEIGKAFAADEHAEDVDTIGGMIFNALGRVPSRGEVVQPIPGFEFHVLDADPRRVKRVRIVQTRTGDRRRRASKEPADG
ncbi:hemolysin family protein [Mesorhizobium xinjiangense]|uniref:hemolysin family protein n=1 Tax=Mesorhizobium xinjiangense TaxID=2678685 RepID=UPI0012ED3F87|nr:hemolysin family protein [Mesorhizobium xinjiangense]